ncbi:hypothetical protein PROFUN_03088 [Planoprotostelium fungivorum]|uniref:Carboxypeptidase regulatory-like domain-containing protein n=1 Tax=Planoprotostelium fungivorum TaxID=1890364 RepID=A0A2P6NQ65_9EUKA|nr:hypothetical protein PROFUN_03088 [Planoprotostelium fungivorum]
MKTNTIFFVLLIVGAALSVETTSYRTIPPTYAPAPETSTFSSSVETTSEAVPSTYTVPVETTSSSSSTAATTVSTDATTPSTAADVTTSSTAVDSTTTSTAATTVSTAANVTTYSTAANVTTYSTAANVTTTSTAATTSSTEDSTYTETTAIDIQYPLTGIVKSARSGKPLINATVVVTSFDGNFVLSQKVNSEGRYKFSVPAGDYDLVAISNKYITISYEITITNATVEFELAMSPQLKYDNIRFVLVWFRNPQDLDAQLTIDDRCTVSIVQPNCAEYNATLEASADNGFGPETISIMGAGGHTLKYTVQWTYGRGSWATSGAVLTAYDHEGKIGEFKPAETIRRKKWEVLTINRDGKVELSSDTVPVVSKRSL